MASRSLQLVRPDNGQIGTAWAYLGKPVASMWPCAHHGMIVLLFVEDVGPGSVIKKFK